MQDSWLLTKHSINQCKKCKKRFAVSLKRFHNSYAEDSQTHLSNCLRLFPTSFTFLFVTCLCHVYLCNKTSRVAHFNNLCSLALAVEDELVAGKGFLVCQTKGEKRKEWIPTCEFWNSSQFQWFNKNLINYTCLLLPLAFVYSSNYQSQSFGVRFLDF